MADGMKISHRSLAVSVKSPSEIVARLLVLAGCCLASMSVYAEQLADPTRPPDSILAPVVEGGKGQALQSSGLHVIIIGKQRRTVVIDGQTVELGEHHGDAKLVEVNESGAVMRGAQGVQKLQLFPDVNKTTVKTGSVGGKKNNQAAPRGE